MPPQIDTGDTAWMLVATALVLLMTPALGLFYAGLVRSKNTLNTFMMSIAALALVTVLWAAVGYSLAFDEGNGFIGGFGHAFLSDVKFAPREGTTIPHLLFFAYQASFCILTSALVSGAVVERMRFRSYLVFLGAWSVLVYPVMAHWGFGGGWLADRGTLDFAGGVPVEMASGFSAFAAAMVVGVRKDYGRQALLPHNAVYALLGAGLLWFGWFGFNGGSGFNTGDASILAFTNTLLAPASSLVVWFALDFIRGRKVTAIGAATAIIVGCVLITPAAGFVSPGWAMLLGALGAFPSYAFIVWRPRTRLDETLDVLAAHGLAGLFGILFIGFFAQEAWNGVSDGLLYGNAEQLADQAMAVLVAPAYAFAATFVILRVLALVMPLRVTEREESLGLDVVEHGEEAYVTGEGAILVTAEMGTRGRCRSRSPRVACRRRCAAGRPSRAACPPRSGRRARPAGRPPAGCGRGACA
jgi:ammonium transporter, Amt family